MNIQGKRPLATFTDQASSPADWTFSWFDLTHVAITATGHPVPQSGSIKHGATVKTIKDNKGNTVTCLATDEMITIEIVAVPLGTTPGSDVYLTSVKDAAQFPKPLAFVTIAGAPAIVFGSFSNIFNSTDWIYQGDGEITLASDGEWGMRFTLVRYLNVTAAAAVVL